MRTTARDEEAAIAGTPLRRQLVVLTAAAILPLAVMAGIGLYVLLNQQRVQAERVGLELARSVANAVDAELRSTISVLDTLATTPTLDLNDLAGFRDRALRVIGARRNWSGVVLSDAAGNILMDTRAAPGSTIPAVADEESFDRVVRTRAPATGSLIRQPNTPWLFVVRSPVIRGATLKYVVTALITPDAIRDVLVRQQLPEDWVISILDAHGLRVARSRAHDENLGGRLAETAQQVVAGGGAEGFGVSYTLEGERIFTPYSRLVSSGWIAVLGFPTALADAAAHRAFATYGGGVLLSIVLGSLGAMWVARTITRPIAGLRAAAEAVGRRRMPRPPETAIQEIREVAAALTAAAADLTASEAQRDELLRKERLAREAAEDADRAKDEFMAVLSHELRTPLNAVYGWAKMLQDGKLHDAAIVERAKNAIVRSAEAQTRLIDDLLDVSRIASGKLRLEFRRVDLPQVLQAAVDAVRPAADAKALRIQTTLDPDAGNVHGDPGRLQQIVWNLLMNAVKFTPAGGTVDLQLRREPARIRIVVTDTGQGIAPELLPHVFDRFRQADSSSTRPHGGLGLGLTLVRHLAELHGGTVVAESAGEGRGATFTVSVPTAAESPAEPAAGAESSRPAAEAATDVVRLDGVRVLVADDDSNGLTLAETILAEAGAVVRTCPSASTALELLQQWRPDVLVSDIEMPEEDGYSLIRKVRALAAHEGGATPAIALTAYGGAQDRLRSVAAGYTLHVAKPVDPGELTALIAGVAGSPDRSRAS